MGGTCTSDARFKTDVRPISGALSRLSLLNPVNYRFKVDEFPGRGFGTERESGFIAQELQKVFPNLVITGDDGYLRVRYGLELQMETVAAIKELKSEKDTEILLLKAENKEIKAENLAIKSLLCEKFPEAKICDRGGDQ